MNSITHSSRKVFFNSQGKHNQGQYSTDITFQIPPIILDNNDPSHYVIGLESLTLPLSIQMINDSNNKLEINGVLCIIPAGNYTITNLISFLNTFYSTVALFTYNQDINKIRLSSLALPYYTIGLQTTSQKILGAIPSITQFSNDTYFQNVVNLVSTASIIFTTPNIQLSNYDNTSDGNNTLAKIPITCQPNEYLQFYNPVPFYSIISNRVLQIIHIKLLTDNYTPLVLSDGITWSAVLRIDYIDKNNHEVQNINSVLNPTTK